jgi:hypothetical protein
MKVKLLKKLRKRYNWYFNNDGFPVLIDHYNKNVTIYDLEYLTYKLKYTIQDLEAKVKVSHTEWALRWLKTDILKDYGWSVHKSFYKKANKRYKLRLTK